MSERKNKMTTQNNMKLPKVNEYVLTQSLRHYQLISRMRDMRLIRLEFETLNQIRWLQYEND